MKLAISNIAWAPEDASTVYRLMHDRGVQGLEIAPALAFPGEDDPFVPSLSALRAFRAELAAFDISAISVQSLLFGVTGARLFGDLEEQRQFHAAMMRAIGFAERLEIGNLVFGSPANRCYPESLSEQQATGYAIDVFRDLGNAALKGGATLSIEPNPAAYGTNFLTTVSAAARFVNEIGHPGIGLNFDIGAAIMNGETDIGALAAASGNRVTHTHLSEPQLAPAPADVGRTREVVTALSKSGYDGWFSIEMRRPAEGGLAIVDAALGRGVEAISSMRSLHDA
ncbi:sugar phosphate isomerase/epimerase family protein [Sphingomonas yabuuchiae]|jgi:sugar phosphate isomerase/epimerase|uniref:Sugar phosphate isomerase/epimerase n=1 Tax=Sphingomonas yabuuchiae TaxID=172044 RepID=A0AA41DED3_9SPHN|nr:sugar phosphate isomerase/epimerase family protein [Sphingomonas yabuuchiae]MBB4611419.1 sugar phosphate isomerase/epimerase [Sphingomonas yabuuchiae]MBN3557005.1 sugar phosphate isomerase/epimerase [Sphingomonas yabuuchiae]